MIQDQLCRKKSTFRLGLTSTILPAAFIKATKAVKCASWITSLVPMELPVRFDGRATYPAGYYFPYGFIVKYGGGPGASNERIAKYDSGIDYYVGHQGLWVTPKTGGTTTCRVYFVFSFGDQIAYDRSTLDLTIPWDEYNPELFTDKALFHIEGTDKKFTVTFEGFEKKALAGSQ